MPLDRTNGSDGTDAAGGSGRAAAAARKAGNPLQRGSACLACRKRKMKCDATKPVCRQCVKANRTEECDYDDGRQKSRTQILQEKIAKLETRIKELEDGDEDDIGLDMDSMGFVGDAGYGSGNENTLFKSPSQFDLDLTSQFGGSGAGSSTLSFDPAFGGAGQYDAAAASSLGFDVQPHIGDHHQQFNAHGTPTFAPPFTHSPPATTMASSSSSTGTVYPPTAGIHHGAFFTSADALEMSAFIPAAQQDRGTSQLHSHSVSSSTWPPAAIDNGTGMDGTRQYMEYLGAPIMQNSPAHSSGSSSHGQGVWTGQSQSQTHMLGMPAYTQMHGTGNATFYNQSSGGSTAAGYASGSGSTALDSAFFSSQVQTHQQHSYDISPSASGSSASYGLGSTSGLSPIPGPSMLASAQRRVPSSGRADKQKAVPSVWEREVLRREQRQVLVDIFLPHARQCGLALSPARLYARMRVLTPSTTNDDSEPLPPPAHPCLAHAIYLLAAHFSASTASQSATTLPAKSKFSQYEPHFLSRALRGIASALEEGEAAAGGGARSRRSSRASSVASGSSSAGGSRSGHTQARNSAAASPAASTSSAGGSSPSSQYALPSRGLSTASTDPDDDFYGPNALGAYTGVVQPSDAATPLLDAVQASALLAVYFFGKARLLEGYYHVSAAARLAVALGLHQIRTRAWAPVSLDIEANGEVPAGYAFRQQAQMQNASSGWASSAGVGERWASGSSCGSASSVSGGGSGGAGTVQLPPAVSARAHAERVAAFWCVFSADRVWAVATGLPSSLPDDAHPQLRIESVWPWDVNLEGSQESSGKEVTPGLASLYKPSASMDIGHQSPPYIPALHAKAAAFFEKAARVSSMQNDPSYWATLQNLIHALGTFISSLPPLSRPTPSPSPSHSPYPHQVPNMLASDSNTTPDPELALVHILAHAAALQLHHPRLSAGANDARGASAISAQAAMHAVHALISSSGPQNGGVDVLARMDPAIGTALMCVADVLLCIKNSGTQSLESITMQGVAEPSLQPQPVDSDLDAILAALKGIGLTFPIALYQAQKIEQTRVAQSIPQPAMFC